MIFRSSSKQPIPTVQLLLASVLVGVSALSATPLPSPVPDSVQCQSAEACFQLAVEMKEMQDDSSKPLPQVIGSLQNIQKQFPDTVWAKRAGVHLGLLQKKSSPTDAISYFQKALEAFPILEDYLQFWTAESLLIAHRPREAAEIFEKIGKQHPQSRLREQSLLLAGQAWRDSGNCEFAIPWFSLTVKTNPKSLHAPNALLEMGKCQLMLHQEKAARQSLREVWWRFPDKPEAEVAQTILAKPSMATKLGPTLDERYKRALFLYKSGNFVEAISWFRRYLRQVTKGKKHDEAEYKLAMAMARLKQYAKAEKVFRRISKSQSPRRGEGVVWLARSYLRQGKGPELLSLQKKVRSKGISGDRQALIHIFAGVWLSDQGKSGQALSAFRKAYQAARSSRKRQDALWRMTWIYYEQEEYIQVLSTLEKLLRISKGDVERARARYWKARVYEQLQQSGKAQDIYQELVQDLPLSYYGQLAKARLLQPVSILNVGMFEEDASFHNTISSKELWQDLHYRKALELVGLQLFLEAGEELKALTKRSTSKSENLNQIITTAEQTGSYDFGIRLAIRHFGHKLKKGLVPRSSHIWKGAYPTGHIPTIQQYVPSGIDPYLVAGLIREESLYDSRAISRVGALGLMQLMPKTANRVARRLGLNPPSQSELFNAQTNIQLGANYVGQLVQEFKGNLVYAVAAYNAGPHVVRRWIAQDPDADPDEFVERISYRETRGYVKRVLGSYRVYRALSSQSCQSVSLDRMC